MVNDIITLPELWIPFIIIRNTTVHESNKHAAIHHLIPPKSFISDVISNVSRYQKYAVSDDLAHSATSVTLPKLSVTVGQLCHGSVNYKNRTIKRMKLN